MTTPSKENMEIAERITGPCICHQDFKVRKLLDPACPYHNYCDEIAAALEAKDEAHRVAKSKQTNPPLHPHEVERMNEETAFNSCILTDFLRSVLG